MNMPAPKLVCSLPEASNFWIGVEYPQALAVAVDVDADGHSPVPPFGQLRPAFLHPVWIGRGIRAGARLRNRRRRRHCERRKCGRSNRAIHSVLSHGIPPFLDLAASSDDRHCTGLFCAGNFLRLSTRCLWPSSWWTPS
jgi:hypothetical protein